jgi:hypothetical protein
MSTTLQRMSSRCACNGLTIWVDMVGYFRRVTTTRPPRFGA